MIAVCQQMAVGINRFKDLKLLRKLGLRILKKDKRLLGCWTSKSQTLYNGSYNSRVWSRLHDSIC
jgi:hypothetical protein